MVPRHNNIFWPQLSDDRLICSVIADGWHVPQSMLNCIVRCKTLERLILTSDVSGFGGCSAGRYRTGDVEVDILDDGRIVVAGQTQFLAGSGATTGDCVVKFMSMCGVSLPEAWKLASTRPAALLNRHDEFLAEGQTANLTLFRISGLAENDITGMKSTLGYQPVGTVIHGQVIS
jgi:N-acetylglucosamine-6-phosphate deacetylase